MCYISYAHLITEISEEFCTTHISWQGNGSDDKKFKIIISYYQGWFWRLSLLGEIMVWLVKLSKSSFNHGFNQLYPVKKKSLLPNPAYTI